MYPFYLYCRNESKAAVRRLWRRPAALVSAAKVGKKWGTANVFLYKNVVR